MAEFKADIDILVECVRYQQKNPDSLKHSLMTLSSLVATDEAKNYFRESGGLKYVYNLLLRTESPDIIVAILFCLASAIEKNVYSQRILTQESVFSMCRDMLQTPASSKLQQAAVFLLLCLVASNSQAQNLTRETGCLANLMDIFRGLLENGSFNTAAEVGCFSLVTSTLSVCVNNPQNDENQRLCSTLLPQIFSCVVHISQTQVLLPVLSLTGVVVANNVFNQDRVGKCGGLNVMMSCLLTLIERGRTEEDCLTAAVQVVSTLDSCFAENDTNISKFMNLCGTGPLFILLTPGLLSQQEQLQVVIAISHLLTNAGDTFVLPVDDYQKLVTLLTQVDDEELLRALKYLLQLCKNSNDESGKSSAPNMAKGESVLKQSNHLILQKIDELASKLDTYQAESKQDTSILDNRSLCSVPQTSKPLRDISENHLNSLKAQIRKGCTGQDFHNSLDFVDQSSISNLERYPQEPSVEAQQKSLFNWMWQLKSFFSKPLVEKQWSETESTSQFRTLPEYSLSNGQNNCRYNTEKRTHSFYDQLSTMRMYPTPQTVNSKPSYNQNEKTIQYSNPNVQQAIFDYQHGQVYSFPSANKNVSHSGPSHQCNNIVGGAQKQNNCVQGNTLHSLPIVVHTRQHSGLPSDNIQSFQRQNPGVSSSRMLNKNNSSEVTDSSHQAHQSAVAEWVAESQIFETQNPPKYFACSNQPCDTPSLSCGEKNEEFQDHCVGGSVFSPSEKSGWIKSSKDQRYDNLNTIQRQRKTMRDPKDDHINTIQQQRKQSRGPRDDHINTSIQSNGSVRSTRKTADQFKSPFKTPGIPNSRGKFLNPADVQLRRRMKTPSTCGSSVTSSGQRRNVRVLARKPVIGIKTEATTERSICPRTPIMPSPRVTPLPSPAASEFDLSLLHSAHRNKSKEKVFQNAHVTPFIKKNPVNQRCWTEVRATAFPNAAYSRAASVRSKGQMYETDSDSFYSQSDDTACSQESLDANDVTATQDGQLCRSEKKPDSCPGCVKPCGPQQPVLNSRTYNIALETTAGTCKLHRRIREAEREYIMKRKSSWNIPLKSRPLPALGEIKLKSGLGSSQPRRTLSVYDFTSSGSEEQKRKVSPPEYTTHRVNNLHKLGKQAKKCRIPYSEEEITNLTEGVKKFGSKWTQILLTYTFHRSRTAVDLKEKYQRLLKKRENPKQQRRKKPSKPFSMCEERRLMRGVKMFGYNWKGILKTFHFVKGRTADELRNKWRTKMNKVEQ